jgi:uncharacterized membrane protein
LTAAGRLVALDVARGAAVVAMVLYHFSYDLAYFGVFDLSAMRSGPGYWAGRTIGGTFIFIAGISLSLRYARSPGAAPFVSRGSRVFAYGMVLTVLTLLFTDEPILFGILHLIGLSMILAYPLLRLGALNLLPAALFISLGLLFGGASAPHPWLVPFGVEPPFFMLDYWPLFPWFGVILLGSAAGTLLKAARAKLARSPAPLRPLVFLGRNSLTVYFVHQPVLIAALVLLGAGDAGSFL